MFKKITASVVAVLALGAGVAYAATQPASADGTQVCVNRTNGLMDAVSSPGSNVGTIGGTSLTHTFQGVLIGGQVNVGYGSTIASASGATATITYGVRLSEADKTCKLFWQAIEAPNQAPRSRPGGGSSRAASRV